jgi:hypothetical protein
MYVIKVHKEALMKLVNNNRLSTDSKVSLSKASQIPELPHVIIEQEAEAESLFRSLTRFRDRPCLRGLQHRTACAWESKIAGWILIVAFVLTSIIEFYLLCRT